jgi:hypothetical protein
LGAGITGMSHHTWLLDEFGISYEDFINFNDGSPTPFKINRLLLESGF